MLRNILINEGRWTNIATAGNHINIVLAAGEIMVRAELENGRTYATPAVQGMALELPRFKNVQISANTSQQTKIWVGDIPLSYSPDTQRAVGSSALTSAVAQVFSNVVTEILPAQVGRNKITLNPSKEIFIGGVDMNLKSGIRLLPNTPFTLQTQGAVYAYETSGDYPPFYTAKVTDSDFETGVQGLGTPHGTDASIYETENSQYAYAFTNGSATARRLNKGDYSYVNNVSLVNDFYFVDAQINGSILYWMNGQAFGSYLTEFDLETGAKVETTVTKPDGTRIEQIRHSFIRGDFIYYLPTGEAQIYRAPLTDKSDAQPLGVPIPHNDGSFMSVWSFGVGANGELVVAGKLIWRSVDNGATWQNGQTLPIDFGNVVKRFHLDTSDDVCYMTFNDEQIHKSLNYGASWELEIDTFQLSGGQTLAIESMDVLLGAVAATGGNGAFFRNSTGEWKYKRITEFAGGNGNTVINSTGTVHFVSRNQVDYFVKGQRVAANGLPVAVMAEVN